MSMTSFVHRLGMEANRKRNRVAMSTKSDGEILEGITGSRQAADVLLAEFGTLKGIAAHGGRKGFGDLQSMPGVSWAVVGKLEAWLESLPRVMS